ncbi:MAG: hypothetical protein ABI192_10900 [Bradyrhizobium sp.]
MNTGLYRTEWTGPAGLGNRLSAWVPVGISCTKTGLIWSAVALAALGGAWMLLSGEFGGGAEGEPVMLELLAEPDPLVAPTAAQAAAIVPEVAVSHSPGALPEAAASADRLKISSQHWRRGGLGSNALVTFTLRNGNDYAVKDIEISCAFSRGDGSHVTNRTRVIHDTVKTRGRKTFAGVHVGFVNINADRAKCAPVAASRV